MAGSPGGTGRPGLVTNPTPSPRRKTDFSRGRGPFSSRTFAPIRAPCVTSGSSPAFLIIRPSPHCPAASGRAPGPGENRHPAEAPQGLPAPLFRPGPKVPPSPPRLRPCRWKSRSAGSDGGQDCSSASTPPQVGDGNQNQAEDPQPLAGQLAIACPIWAKKCQRGWEVDAAGPAPAWPQWNQGSGRLQSDARSAPRKTDSAPAAAMPELNSVATLKMTTEADSTGRKVTDTAFGSCFPQPVEEPGLLGPRRSGRRSAWCNRSSGKSGGEISSRSFQIWLLTGCPGDSTTGPASAVGFKQHAGHSQDAGSAQQGRH